MGLEEEEEEEGHILAVERLPTELKPRESSSARAEGGATQSAKAPESEGTRRAAATAGGGESPAEGEEKKTLICEIMWEI